MGNEAAQPAPTPGEGRAGFPRSPARHYAELPGPTRLPLVGNALQYRPSQAVRILEGWADRYGSLYQMRLLKLRMLVVSEPDMAAAILKQRPDRYRRLSALQPVLRELELLGVFGAEGDDWRRQRRLVMQAFSRARTADMAGTVDRVVGRLCALWEGSAGRSRDVLADLACFTADVTALVAFGRDLNTLQQPSPLQDDIARVFEALGRRATAPVPYWRYLPLPADRRVREAQQRLRATVADIAETPASPDTGQSTLLTQMLHARDDGSARHRLDPDELFANVMTVLLAGEDTTSSAIAWMLHYLAHAPDCQQRVREEARAAADAPPTLAPQERWPYLMAVFRETLRLRSPAPLIFLECNQDNVIGDVGVDSGTGVLVLTRHITTSSRWFPRSRAFEPERWLGPSPTGLLSEPAVFMPFGAGPRACPGRNLAQREACAAVAEVCRRFRVAPVDSAERVKEEMAFTLVPRGLRLRFHPDTDDARGSIGHPH